MKSRPSTTAAVRSTLLLALVAALCALPSPALAARVFLDPGHGGAYPGAVYSGAEEQYVNLLIALEARSVLQSRGHSVSMSRTGDTTVCSTDIATWHWDDDDEQYYLYEDDTTGAYPIPYDDLQARCDKANSAEADIFISIHNNAGGGTGTETYYNSWETATDTGPSKTLATYLQTEIVASAGTTNRKVDDVGYYVIRWANMPAALVEVAFLDSTTDRTKLLSLDFRHKVAVGIANAVDRYLAADLIDPIEPRIAGDTRYETAVSVAKKGWPSGADTVILASGENWPDSLTAGPLSYQLDAPLLLTNSQSLPTVVAKAITSLAPENVIVLGGEAAVTSAVATAAADAAGIERSAVERIAGDDRYETAALMAERLGVTPGAGVTIVSGEAFPDAVSASAFSAMRGMPILLTPASSLSASTSKFITEHSTEVTSAVIVGGSAAVSDSVKTTLASKLKVSRVYGANRYATNVAVVKKYWPTGDITPYAATGKDFPDALAAGPLAAKNGEPVMLFGWRYLDKTSREFVMHRNADLTGWTMVGGSSALDYLLEWELTKARRLAPPS